MASKQRRPGREQEPAQPSSSSRQGPAQIVGTLGPTAARPAAREGLLTGGQPRGERLAQALLVGPRISELTRHLVETVDRSALPDDRKIAIRDRLMSDQHAADVVSAAVVRAFGDDRPDLRSALVDAARSTGDDALVASLAAAVGRETEAVRGLCDDLDGFIATWWHEEEDEEEAAAPGDYAAEESGS